MPQNIKRLLWHGRIEGQSRTHETKGSCQIALMETEISKWKEKEICHTKVPELF